MFFDLRFHTIKPYGQKSNQNHFRLPGAYHLAKRVTKVIHILHQGFMIRNEFKLIAVERRNLSEFCIFAAHIYIPACIACPVARRSDAPVSDLMLIRAIIEELDVLKAKFAYALSASPSSY